MTIHDEMRAVVRENAGGVCVIPAEVFDRYRASLVAATRLVSRVDPSAGSDEGGGEASALSPHLMYRHIRVVRDA